MAVNEDSFKQALGHFASGVTIVTMADGDDLTGLTVSAFCSVSLEPPYILICINNVSSALTILHKTNRFAVNMLAADQIDLSNHFASRIEDKFANIEHHAGSLGVPLLDGVMAQLECSVVNEFPGGDHTIIIGRVDSATLDESKQPLLYYHGQYGAFQ